MTFVLGLLALLTASAAHAQVLTAPAASRASAQAPAAISGDNPTDWVWSADANAFVGFNYQYRKFRDFRMWESQNWLMGRLERRTGSGALSMHGMLSLEALTLHDIGSAQVFQTGETFRGAPLIDYQHPHDLFMGLGAEYRRTARGVTVVAALDIVGAPSLGPAAFMHRASARDNPQAPLSHHLLDSSHITPGVVRGGIGARGWHMEASWFRGREPDERRVDLDLGALDSGAARLSWTGGPWSAQASAAYLTQPEAVTPYDAKRLTASLAYTLDDERRGVSWLAAFGQNREIHGNLEAYLFEASLRNSAALTVYARIESVAKDILDAGFHPRGVFHRHRQSQVAAVTFGYVRDMLRSRAGAMGIGADITGYRVPSNLSEPYGMPVSLHVFLRYRAPRPAPNAPVHRH